MAILGVPWVYHMRPLHPWDEGTQRGSVLEPVLSHMIITELLQIKPTMSVQLWPYLSRQEASHTFKISRKFAVISYKFCNSSGAVWANSFTAWSVGESGEICFLQTAVNYDRERQTIHKWILKKKAINMQKIHELEKQRWKAGEWYHPAKIQLKMTTG